MSADIAKAREALVRRRLTRRRQEPRVPPRGERTPLSYAQERLWFLDQLWPDRPAYVVPAAYRIRGQLDVPALERAVATVLDRHEALRTCFPAVAGKPYQRVRATVPGLGVTDLSDADDPVAAARALRDAQAELTFDLAEGPLVRTQLLRLGSDDHVLLVTVHHIVFDGMSLDRFAAEVSRAYEGAELPALPLQYRDFAVWQRDHLDAERLERHLAHWRRRLAGAPATLELPADRPRPDAPSFTGAVVPLAVPTGVTAVLRKMASDHSCGLYPIALAAYQALLARHTGATELVVGSPIAGRLRADVENLIGFFVNTVPVYGEMADDPPFAELVRRIQAAAVEAQEHQELPFEKLVEDLTPGRDLARLPLVQVLFNFVTGLDYAALSLRGTEVSDFSPPAGTVRFELELHLLDRGGELTGELIYAVDLFDHDTARRFAGQYLNFLGAVCRDPGQRISRVPIATPDELRPVERRDAPDRPQPATSRRNTQ